LLQKERPAHAHIDKQNIDIPLFELSLLLLDVLYLSIHIFKSLSFIVN